MKRKSKPKYIPQRSPVATGLRRLGCQVIANGKLYNRRKKAQELAKNER